MAALGVRLVIVLNPASAAEVLQVIHNKEVIRKEVTSKGVTSKGTRSSLAINKEVPTAVAINPSRFPDCELASWFSA